VLHQHWFVPHHQTLGPISIIDPSPIHDHDLGVFSIYICAICHKIAQKKANLLKIARFCTKSSNQIHYEFCRNGFIVSDIFYTGPHCQILSPIASYFLATGLIHGKPEYLTKNYINCKYKLILAVFSPR